jgi:hypothetical protein
MLTLAALRALEAVRADKDMASLTWGRGGEIVHSSTRAIWKQVTFEVQLQIQLHEERATMFNGNLRQ